MSCLHQTLCYYLVRLLPVCGGVRHASLAVQQIQTERLQRCKCALDVEQPGAQA